MRVSQASYTLTICATVAGILLASSVSIFYWPTSKHMKGDDSTQAIKLDGSVYRSAVFADGFVPSLRVATSTRGQKYLSQLPFVSVIVVVTSAAGWSDRRQLIRQQFPRNLQLMPNPENSVVLKFAIGTEGIETEEFAKAKLEAGNYSDILFFDCLDEDQDLKHPHLWRRDGHVSSTTSKVLLSIQWAVRHFDFEYYFRLGDDSYFRIDKFMNMLVQRQIPASNAVVGHIMTDRVFDMDQLYPQGMGYGLTYDICLFVSGNAGVLMNTAPEDCVVARWLFAVGAEFVDSPRWLDIHMGDSCHPDMVLAHKLPTKLWSEIADDGTVKC